MVLSGGNTECSQIIVIGSFVLIQQMKPGTTSSARIFAKLVLCLL